MLSDELEQLANQDKEGVRKIYEGVFKPHRTLILNDLTIDLSTLEAGTIFYDPIDSKITILKASGRSSINPNEIFEDETITGNLLVENAIQGKHILNNSIPAIKIVTKSITAQQIEDGSLTDSCLDDSTIQTRSLSDLVITTVKLADLAVTNGKLADNAVATRNIINGAVTGDKIKDKTIATKHLSSGCVTKDIIMTNEIENHHLTQGCVTGIKIKANEIATEHLQDNCVTDIKIQSKAIKSHHFAENSIPSVALQKECVTNEKIGTAQVSLSKLAINLQEILNNAVQSIKGVVSVITLKAQTVFTNSLTADNVTVKNTFTAQKDITVNNNINVKNNVSCGGKVYHAVYNDLAEGFIPGEALEPGDVVEIREDGKVYKSSLFSEKVVGVISSCYAQCFGATEEEIERGEKVPVGIIGQIPVKIYGSVKVGQHIIAGADGTACVMNRTCNSHRIIGKALEEKTSTSKGMVKCLIFPN